MNLALLAAIIVARDKQQAEARRHRRAREEARKKKNAPSNSSSYPSKGYNENEYFNMIVSEDPILVAFFQTIEKKGKEIDQKDAEEIRKKIEEKLKVQAERVKKIDEVLEELKSSGMELTTVEKHYNNVTVGGKVIEVGRRGFGEKGEYAKYERSFVVEYKGIELSSDWFKPANREVNPFDYRYNSWYELNKNVTERIEEIEKAIAKQERKVKYAVFDKYDKEAELKKLRKDLELLKKNKSYGEELKKNKEIFDEITPEQKELLFKYYELVADCRMYGFEIDKDVDIYNGITGYEFVYGYKRQKSAAERNKWGRSLEALIEDGEVSEEIIDAIDTIFSEENIGYKEYFEGYSEYDMQRKGHSKEFQELVAWYIETRKEKIALKALHRKEVAYKALEDEYKKLCETVDLVDRAEELEENRSIKEGDEKNGE